MIKHNGQEVLTGPDVVPGYRVPENVGEMDRALKRFLCERAGEVHGKAAQKRSLLFGKNTRRPLPPRREQAPQSAAEMLGEKAEGEGRTGKAPTPPRSSRTLTPRKPHPSKMTPQEHEKQDAMMKQRGVRLRMALDAAGWNFYGSGRCFAERLGWRSSRVSQLLGGFCSGGLAEMIQALQIDETWLRTGEGQMFKGEPVRPTSVEKAATLENRAAAAMQARGTAPKKKGAHGGTKGAEGKAKGSRIPDTGDRKGKEAAAALPPVTSHESPVTGADFGAAVAVIDKALAGLQLQRAQIEDQITKLEVAKKALCA